MQMTPPAGGDSFVGRDGFTYTAASGVTIEVGRGANQQAFLRNWTEATPVAPVTQLTPLTGFTYNVPDGVQHLLITPAGTIAAGTVSLPPNPSDNFVFNVSSSQTITALTVTAQSGRTIYGAPTTIGAAAPFEYRYNQAQNAWFRR